MLLFDSPGVFSWIFFLKIKKSWFLSHWRLTNLNKKNLWAIWCMNYGAQGEFFVWQSKNKVELILKSQNRARNLPTQILQPRIIRSPNTLPTSQIPIIFQHERKLKRKTKRKFIITQEEKKPTEKHSEYCYANIKLQLNSSFYPSITFLLLWIELNFHKF